MLAPDNEARIVPDPTASSANRPGTEPVDHQSDQASSKKDLALENEHRDRQQHEDRQAPIDAIDQKVEPGRPHEIDEENDIGAEESEDDGNTEQDEDKERRHEQREGGIPFHDLLSEFPAPVTGRATRCRLWPAFLAQKLDQPKEAA
jgi:hypothetical protein